MKIAIRQVLLAACLGAICMLGGCLSTTPLSDASFGESVVAIKKMQILHPLADSNDLPDERGDGTSGVATVKNYMKSFEKPVPAVNAFSGSGISNN